MPKQRRLTDLYVVGKEMTFDDGEGDPITVFIRKLSPVDHEAALRTANAARSRAATIKADPEGDEWQALNAMVINYDKAALMTYLVEDLRTARQSILEARTADEEEWKDHDYLQGLRDAWEDGVERTILEDPDDVEANRVKDELARFLAQVDEHMAGEISDLEQSMAERPIEELREKVLDKIVEVRSSIAWLNEYRRCEVWLSVRELDRKSRYFQNRAEVDDLPSEIFGELSATYVALSVEPTEGKGSAATPPSSPSSEQQGEATDESSGQTVAAA